MTTFGVDISTYQKRFPMKAAQVSNDLQFFICRATRGADNYVDPTYLFNLAQAKQGGALFAATHMTYRDSSPSSQAKRIMDTVARDIPVMLDHELTTKTSGPTLKTVEAIADIIEHAGWKTFLYQPHWYWQGHLGSPSLARWKGRLVASSYPHPVAGSPRETYPGDNANPWTPYGGIAPIIWQFTDNSRIATYGKQAVDGDAYRGTRAQLAATGLFKDFGTTTQKKEPDDMATPEVQALLAEIAAATTANRAAAEKLGQKLENFERIQKARHATLKALAAPKA